MKAQERHHLKQNEFAATTAKVAAALSANRDRVMVILIAVLAIAVVGGGYWWWQKRTSDQAGAMLGQAMAITQARIAPAPTLPGATQAAGTYPTEEARDQAALQAFQQVAATYPSTSAGLAARYHIASSLLSMNKLSEAEQAFRAISSRGGSDIYVPMSKMGLASALAGQKKYDEAIKTLTDLAADRDGALPIDGVLMELARTYVRAGKPQEARAAFKRVVDEFAQSPLAPEARQQLVILG